MNKQVKAIVSSVLSALSIFCTMPNAFAVDESDLVREFRSGNLLAVQKYILQSSDINVVLRLAARINYIALAKFSIQLGADVNAQDIEKHTALHWAVDNDNIEMAEFLIVKCGAKVNIQNELGETALHWAVIRSNVEIVRLLLEHNARFDIRNINGYTALQIAQILNKADIVELFEKNATDPIIEPVRKKARR